MTQNATVLWIRTTPTQKTTLLWVRVSFDTDEDADAVLLAFDFIGNFSFVP